MTSRRLSVQEGVLLSLEVRRLKVTPVKGDKGLATLAPVLVHKGVRGGRPGENLLRAAVIQV